MRLILVLALAAFAGPASAQEEGAEPIEVMVLGTYHFANPGRDVVNIEVDDVRTPRRQRELEALSAALAQWQPDRVLVETQRPGPDFTDERYRDFAPAMLGESRNETVQIGYRLARRMGHEAVYGFDEQPGEGEPDYFPFGALQQWAQDNGRGDEFSGLVESLQALAAELFAGQDGRSIPANLLRHNDPGELAEAHRHFYYGVLRFGDGENQPGADLNAYWYMRNAKMFAKLGLIAEPGERIFVLVGSGHAYWLRHFLENTPGYELVEPEPYLRAAAIAAETESE